jgi:hypothetical protein
MAASVRIRWLGSRFHSCHARRLMFVAGGLEQVSHRTPFDRLLPTSRQLFACVAFPRPSLDEGLRILIFILENLQSVELYFLTFHMEPGNHHSGAPTPYPLAEGNTVGGAKRESSGGPAVGEPGHGRKLHAREPGDPTIALPPHKGAGRWGRPRPHAPDARSWEVRRLRSTNEADEQSRRERSRSWWREGGRPREIVPSAVRSGLRAGLRARKRWSMCAATGQPRTTLDTQGRSPVR